MNGAPPTTGDILTRILSTKAREVAGAREAMSLDALLERLKKSPQWPGMLVIVTYDENGGFWDHVPPPRGDRWGPGTRIATIVIGPMVKKGFVDKTAYDTTSILKLITRRFALEPLPGVRGSVGDLSNAIE